MYKIKLFILQTIGLIMKKLGRGSSIVGFLDEKLRFNVLTNIDFSHTEIIYVVGTNGKTSITNTLNELYIKNEQNVLSNIEGANLTTGIKTSIIMDIKAGEIGADVLLLEVDEKTVSKISEILKPQHIILTNFFRDQLDRYHEIDLIIAEIMEVIALNQPIVYYNAQDPLIEEFLSEIPVEKVTYILEKDAHSSNEPFGIVEMKYCPKCSTKLNYEYYHIGHIGAFCCPKCGFQPQEPTYIIKNNTSGMEIFCGEKEISGININLNMLEQPKYFSINIALILTFAINKFKNEDIQKSLSNIKMPNGRNQKFELNSKKVYLNLAKNVVGMEQTIQYLLDQNEPINLIIAFNDNPADGTDVSWIWDTKFETLIPILRSLHICGQRKNDMNLRFLYEGYDNIKIYESIDDCLKNLFVEEDFVIMSNYTPLNKINMVIHNKIGK